MAKKKAIELQKPATIQFFWRTNEGRYRVWRSDWGSDQFEILSNDEFNNFLTWALRFSFLVTEVGDDD